MIRIIPKGYLTFSLFTLTYYLNMRLGVDARSQFYRSIGKVYRRYNPHRCAEPPDRGHEGCCEGEIP